MKSQIFKTPLPYLALFLAHFIWGINFVVAKITLEEFPIMSLAFFRFAFACLLIAPFILSLDRKQRKVKTKHLPKLIAMGLFLITFSIILFYEGISRTTAINASTLTLVIPILSVLGGWWFLKEKIYWINLVGICLGLIGAFVVIGFPLLFVEGLNPRALLGNLLIIGSCITFVIGTVFSKEMLTKYSTLMVTGIAFLIGAITFFIPAILDYINNPNWVLNLSVLGVLGFLFITILSSVCAFFLLNWGLEKTGVIKANLFQYMEPAVAATLAVPLLGERISFSFIIGTCLVVLGVYWGTFGKQEHHHPHHKHHRN